MTGLDARATNAIPRPRAATAGPEKPSSPETSARGAEAGLTVLAVAEWPGGTEPPRLAGFVHSDFNPLVAAVAGRCLAAAPEPEPDTALVLVSDLGDVESAAHVARAVDAGTRVGPLFFFQSVPNAVLGHVAAKWALTGPVSCLCDAGAGLDAARGLLADGDARRVLLIDVSGGTATAVLLSGGTP